MFAKQDFIDEYSTTQAREVEQAIKFKAYLLTEGIAISPSVYSRPEFGNGKPQLYEHSSISAPVSLPENLILYRDKRECFPAILVKPRYNPKSPWYLIYEEKESQYYIEHRMTKNLFPIEIPHKKSLSNIEVEGTKLENLVQKLGLDLCGAVPSNYCFYYKDKKECRFCEIYQTYQKYRNYPTPHKKPEVIVEAYKQAFINDPSLKYAIITTGNYISYDHTVKEFCQIAEQLADFRKSQSMEIVGCLMPPSDFSLIDKLKESGFDKLYFDIDVYDPLLFKEIAPGKVEYGYENLFQALKYAINIFGKGNIFSNIIYGIQSLPLSLETKNWVSQQENDKMLQATKDLLALDIVPTYTIYHSSGKNKIGPHYLDPEALFEFACNFGQLVYESHLIPSNREAMIFSVSSINSTLYNEGYALAAIKKQEA